MPCRQYRDHHGDRLWFFVEFLAALSDRELWGLRRWQLERLTADETRDDAALRLEMIEREFKRRVRRRILRG
jgi:hypothetical protein